MIVTIAKQFTFDAAHHINTFPDGHKCKRMHGHTYHVELVFRGDVDERGLCAGIDYADVAEFWAYIHNAVDHRVLNEIRGLEIPTTEHLAGWIATTLYQVWRNSRLDRLVHALDRIRICESATTWCEYIIVRDDIGRYVP